MSSYIYEEFLDVSKEFLNDFLPLELVDRHSESDRSGMIFREMSKIGIVVDNEDYSGGMNGYIKNLCVVKRFDVLELPETFKERVEWLLRFKNKFSLEEIEFFFRDIFVDKKEFEKFKKRYVVKNSEKLSLGMLQVFRKFYPTYLEDDNFIKPHPFIKNFFEYGVYKLKKTWS